MEYKGVILRNCIKKIDLTEPYDQYKIYFWGSFATSATDKEIEYILDNLFKSLEQVKTDYKSGSFKNYNPFKTKAGISVNSIEDAISFHTFHEGIHLGRIMEIRKLV